MQEQLDGAQILQAENEGREAFLAGKSKLPCPYDARIQGKLTTAYFVGFDRQEYRARKKDRIENGMCIVGA